MVKKITYFFMKEINKDNITPCKVSNYAKRLQISETKLRDFVKKTTNKTPKEIIEIHKISIAKKLIMNTNYSISDIAYKMGFKDSNNFTRFFKTKTGFTPLNYRKTKL